ncbi:MAG: rhomboid family intramembrane serine protease [Chitinophagales bacterium]|nr:rhomboid family intramembrane serine protease [Chitinophagales bacterium]
MLYCLVYNSPSLYISKKEKLPIGNNIFEDLRYRFITGNAVVKLILCNVGIFFLFSIVKLVLFLFQHTSWYDFAIDKLMLPAYVPTLLKQPWTVLSYMFLHDDFFHILFNMLWLYWFGEIFVLYLGDKKIVPLYLLGGLSGALFYLLSYNLLPVFATERFGAMLLGASASVLAIVFGAATLNPDHQMRLLFLGDVRIKYIALFSLLIDIINIPEGNAGGYIAHLGGALCGWLFIKGLRSGVDASRPFARFTASVARQLGSRPSGAAKPATAVKQVKERAPKTATTATQVASDQERLDEILDKISRSGYDSLTDEEKKFLYDFSNR